jgi:hypothetical protein
MVMKKDFAFLFYPGDYLRDTQCLSEKTQVAYDRIICEHMRNITISQQQLNFFTKRLTQEEKDELFLILDKVSGGYQINWVVESINKRKSYSESRRNNRNKTHNNICNSYVNHMEIENENININESINNNKVQFEKFWNLYDKKEDRIKCEGKWNRLTDKERINCINNLPAYILSTPDKQFRKNPSTYLNNKSWENEIIKLESKKDNPKTYEEMLELTKFNPDIWKNYKSIKRDGERKAIFIPINQ